MSRGPDEVADDDLSRQRRKRDERLLAQPLPDVPELTVGDLVADVMAACDGDLDDPRLDVPRYLAERGHGSPTIVTVVEYFERQAAARLVPSSRRRPLP